MIYNKIKNIYIKNHNQLSTRRITKNHEEFNNTESRDLFTLYDKFPIKQHFREIRSRFVFILLSGSCTFLTCYYYSQELIYLWVKPFSNYNKNFIFINLTEAFYTQLIIATITSFCIVFPFLIYHIWCFFVTSFYSSERIKFNRFITSVLMFFFLGVFIIYFLLLPKICDFFYNFQIKSSQYEIVLQASIYSYIQFTSRLSIMLLLLFQIPILIDRLYIYNLRTRDLFSQNRKYFLFFFILIAALISPPDFISQSIIAGIFFVIFEIAIWYGFIIEKYI